MGALDVILTPSLRFEEILSDGSTLTNPAADSRRLFLGEDGILHLKDSAGTVTSVGATPAFLGASAYRNTNQSLSDSTWTAIQLDNERFDTGSFHDNSSSNTRMTCATAGYYLCDGTVTYANSALGSRFIDFGVNGTRINIAIYQDGGPPSANNHTLAYSDVVSVTAGQYIELFGHQSTGGNLNVVRATLTVSFLGT